MTASDSASSSTVRAVRHPVTTDNAPRPQSLMLTFLGDQVLGQGVCVYSGSVIEVFARAGVGEHTTRSTLTRPRAVSGLGYGSVMAARTKTAKDRPSYRCTECGWQTAKWLGRCPECQAWGTVEEYGAPAVRTTAPGRVTTSAVPIGQVDGRQATARSTGVPELDRVLGGGLVPGAVVLLAGEPGVGKSTLLLDVAAKAASDEHRTLYVTGEESASQVRLRADRIKAIHDHLYLAAETDLSAVLGHLDAVKPSLLILDSVQTIASPEIDGAPGGMAQVREVAGALIRASKERGMSTLLVGHVTKDGAIAGPRLLEHLVDVVLSFEGDRHARLRLVRGVKNRYGATDEVGCFELHDEGITGLADPSGLFLTRRAEPVPGTCLTVTLEGRRPLVAEVQALTVDSQIPSPAVRPPAWRPPGSR